VLLVSRAACSLTAAQAIKRHVWRTSEYMRTRLLLHNVLQPAAAARMACSLFQHDEIVLFIVPSLT
jgi:hypothetical protein